ncbi:MAG: TIGR01777 family oxidoreductase [Candidatus Nanopelagicales bacterium]
MKLVVTGASGLIGSAFVKAAEARGDEVIRLVRRKPKNANEAFWNPKTGEIDHLLLDGADAIVNLAGAGVGDRRWSEKYKKEIYSSRVTSTKLIVKAISKMHRPPKVLVSASAIGYYGDTGSNLVDENAPAGTGFLAEVCVAWESAAKPAQDYGVRVVHPRTGLVLSRKGGLLKRLYPIFFFGLGGRMGNGKQYWSCISLNDQIRALFHLIENEKISGGVNLIMPEAVSNKEFVKTFGKILKRPTVFAVPAIALKIALGEFSSEVLGSVRVAPGKLIVNEFEFENLDLTSALQSALKN